MAIYIDANHLYCRVKTETNPYGRPTIDYKSGVKVLDMIENQPTADVVEVVRCKDCIHHKEQKRRNGIAIYECDFISGLFLDDDFCSRGERKGQEE